MRKNSNTEILLMFLAEDAVIDTTPQPTKKQMGELLKAFRDAKDKKKWPN